MTFSTTAIFSITLIAVLLAGSLNMPLSAYAKNNADAAFMLKKGIIPGHYIVAVDDGVPPEEVARSHGIIPNFVYQAALNGFAGPVAAENLEALKNDARVLYVENDQWVSAFSHLTPNGVNRIDTDKNAIADIDDVNDSPVDIDVAVIDTGVDLDHPDLNVYKATNCAKGGPMGGGCTDGEGDDGNGHGSHVAGTAAAIDNEFGVVGVAPGARIWSVKVLGNDGSGWMSWIIAGVNWVTGNAGEIDVANMSLGCECSSSALDEAIANSVAAGVTYVVAAGNSGKDASTFSPANHPDVITASAMVDTDGKCGGLGPSTSYGNDDTFASFSNFGSLVEIAAPGVQIYSTYKGGTYATLSGTSMASPHVAGAAALYKAANPGSSPAGVRAGLIDSGVSQTLACDTAADDGHGGFGNDPDNSPEPLVYVGTGSSSLTISGLSASPNPFSPNNDSIQDTTTITATLSQSASWSVKIKDSLGNEIKDLGSGTGTSISVSWDGTNSTNSTVSDGNYSVEIVANNDSSSASAMTTITVDNTAPTITVGPDVTDITSSSTTITWTTDETSTSVVQYKKQGDTSWTTVSDSNQVTSHSIALAGLSAETTYEYQVQSTDSAGNTVTSTVGTFTTAAGSTLDVSFGSFSHAQKGKSGGAKLFIPVSVSGTNGATANIDLTIYQSSSEAGSYSVVATLSSTMTGDGTITFEYNQALCGNYYKASATATTSDSSVSKESTTYHLTCS